MNWTDYHSKLAACELTLKYPVDSDNRLAGTLVDAQVDLNPHQVDAALFPFQSPLAKGSILADEVGLGKTIEAGLIISQKWAERKRKILIITPSNLRKQWYQELSEKFFLPSIIIESKSYRLLKNEGKTRPFISDSIVLCSYQFARNKSDEIQSISWDLVVFDEAHRLRNVYKPNNIIANTLKQALKHCPKILLTATPLQNSLLELYGLVSFIDEHIGDNLLALKALEQEFTGKVKCVFIDPPYNTGSAFEHYEDGVEHSIWLGLMRDRLEIIKQLLAEDGSLWITIDDNECHYLKILCDEVFSRPNFVRHITWQKKYSVSNNFKGIASLTDHILVYRKSERFQNNLLPRTGEAEARYSNPDNDPRGPWKAVDYLNQATVTQRPNLVYDICNPITGEIVKNRVKAWKYELETHKTHIIEKRLWWGLRGENSVPSLKLFLSEVRDGMTPHNWWPHAEVGHTDEAKKESIGFFGHKDVFSTPKPERLLHRVLQLATNPGDLVLYSFAGSGTTGAVAHKLGRRWIMVELGEHCHTHIIPRIKKVIDGDDKNGITEAVNWKGGGGFRYYKVAPSLLEKDKWGKWVINKGYNAVMLAKAVCKLEGFNYEPSDSLYWMHGKSTETDFIYVTTQNLNRDQLALLSDEVGCNRSLLVMCSAFRAKAEDFSNLTIKKIPNTVLAECEWGHDDYSLQVENLPAAPKPERKQRGLFDEEVEE